MVRAAEGEISVVWFNWGGVVINDPREALVARFASDLGADPQRIRDTAFGPSLDFFTVGAINERRYWNMVAGELGLSELPSRGELWRAAARDTFVENILVLGLVEDLRSRGFKVGIFSTTVMPTLEVMDERPAYGMFNQKCFSCMEGYPSYEHGFMRRLVSRSECHPRHIMVVDDDERVIQQAQLSGMQGLAYCGVNRLRTGLRINGVSVVA